MRPKRTTPDGSRLPLFSREAHAARREEMRRLAETSHLDVVVVTSPESIYHLTGLDHFGYFAFHMLAIPVRGEPVLVARQMELVTIAHDVHDLEFRGYADNDDIAAYCAETVGALASSPCRIGLEEGSLFLISTVARRISDRPGVEVVDVSEMVANARMVQSADELEVTRRAAAISVAMLEAATDTAKTGVTESEVARAALNAMVAAGGEPPALWPFVRCTRRLNEDHTTWTDYALQTGDALFLELSGSVGRYHAPLGRLLHVGEPPPSTIDVSEVCLAAFAAAARAARPGSTGGDVYAAWQSIVDQAGMANFRRHHCGYVTGIGFPPSWSGHGIPRSLRPGSTLVLREGMVIHLMSWMMGTGRGDYFVSDPVVVTTAGAERLTTTPQTPTAV